MKRSATISLGCATALKVRKIFAIFEAYTAAVNAYITECWDRGGRWNAETLKRVTSPLSYRYRGQALKQAEALCRGTKAAAQALGKKPGKPAFNGGMDLSVNNMTVAAGKNTFDLWVKLATLEKGHPISLPARRTRVWTKWAGVGRQLGGGTLFKRGNRFYVRVTFDVPDPAPKTMGEVVGIDRGVLNVLATSDGQLIGTQLDKHIDRIKRTEPKSRGRRRALLARDQYVNECLKALPFGTTRTFVIEALQGIKRNRRGKLSRKTNRRFSHWTIGRMSLRLQQLCQENRVFLAEVPAAYTSQTCPACGHREKGNRKGQTFRCIRCDHTDHADLVGARNVLSSYSGTISAPRAKVLTGSLGCQS